MVSKYGHFLSLLFFEQLFLLEASPVVSARDKFITITSI